MIEKISDVTVALKKFHEDLKNAYGNGYFECPICFSNIDIDLVEHDCNVIHCNKCNYAYCIDCEYIYDPEPDFVSLLGYKSEKYNYFLWEHRFFDDKPRFVWFEIFENDKEKFIESLVNYIKGDYGRDNFTLEELVSVVDKYCKSYHEVEKNEYYHIDTIRISIGDGIHIEYKHTLFEVFPFF